MKLQFNAISEPGKPDLKWQQLFNTHWPAYKAWLQSKQTSNTPGLKASQAALKNYMPEMWPTYKRLCKLVKADDMAARFLTGFQPPAYISACSQAVVTGKTIQLVRNYDYHPDLMEGSQLFTAWNGKKVIATGDCLIGAVDGMNEDGLAISLTFGGRKEVGVGFGIPFILRYVLEFCSNTEEAVKALTRIPSHMSYNVTVVDKKGSFKTVQMAPDKAPLVTDAAFTTNHQGTVDWPENAAFNKTVERSSYLENMLSGSKVDAATVADSFLKAPLYNKKFRQGFGTLFTSVYRPMEGTVELRWPNDYIQQTFDDFQEKTVLINYDQPTAVPQQQIYWNQAAEENARPERRVVKKQPATQYDWQETVTEILVNAMAQANPAADKEHINDFKEKFISKGEVSWGAVANYWSKMGTNYTDAWQK